MMTNLLNAKELKSQASMVTLLENLGYKPLKKSGKEYIYRSMLREGDSTPSFTVDDHLGAWYDHGTGKGGNIIDFGLKYWGNLSFNEVIEKLNQCLNTLSSVPVRADDKKGDRPRSAVKIPHYIIESTKDLGTHPAITDYLKSRGIFEVAFGYLKEVYYFVEDDKAHRKKFFAAAWKNENGSWEVRNRYFKGCLGRKGITFIKGDGKKLAVFEGYLNFLSWKTDNPSSTHSILVLNTITLLAAGIALAKAFSHIDLYFDRDQGGYSATKDFIKVLPYATDRSEIYTGYNDYNNRLVAVMQGKVSVDEQLLIKRPLISF